MFVSNSGSRSRPEGEHGLPAQWYLCGVTQLPKALVGHTAEELVWEDVAAAKGLSMDQHAAVLEALCRMAAELVGQHADPQKAMAWQDPLSKETEQLLERLRRGRG